MIWVERLDDMKVIGIAGGTASGKSYITNQVIEQLQLHHTIIKIGLDDYYKLQANKTYEERCLTNYDHPSAFDFYMLVQHIKELKSGKSILKPTYDYTIHNRSNITEKVSPADILVLEGLFTLQDTNLFKECDYTIYIDAVDDIRFIRRLQRDMKERARSVESVIDQYLTTVKPMHDLYIAPSKNKADLVIDNSTNEKVDIEAIVSKIESILL